MTNPELLEIIFRTYCIDCMIKKLIKNSSIDGSWQDLEQQIYIQLFMMDNTKLNSLHNEKNLRRWISQIVKNQRNYYKNDYQKTRLREHSEPTDQMLIDIDFSHNYILDWLDQELDKWDWNKQMTKEEIQQAGCYEILKFYLSSGYSMTKIAKQFNCSSTKINKMIISAKNNIRQSYELNYDNWLNDLTFKLLGTVIE